MTPDLVVRGGLVDGHPLDVRCVDGRIGEIGPRLDHRPLDEVIDAAGADVIPGLVDHHVHLRALAAVASSVVVGPPEVNDRHQFAAALAAASRRAAPDSWIRAVGYHESVAGPLDAPGLDAMTGPRPIRVQHRGGSLWILNSAALARLDVASCPADGVERNPAGQPTGRLWRMDDWLGERVGRQPGDLASVSRTAAAAGVTGFTDATAQRTQDDADDLVAASHDGVIVQRLCLMTPVGVRVAGSPGAGRVEQGPVKILLDDTTLPTLDGLEACIAGARREGRAVAVHCVTHLQLVITLAALAAGGAHRGDRIEHAALVADDQLDALRDLGVVVVTQPGLVASRGDQYLVEVEAGDHRDLWRLASLRRAGVAVAIGTDAPFGPADPWVALRAARDRRTPGGHVLSPNERITATEALQMMTTTPSHPGRRRRLAAGQPADLCVLRGRLPDVLEVEGAPPVAHTVVAGRRAFSL